MNQFVVGRYLRQSGAARWRVERHAYLGYSVTLYRFQAPRLRLLPDGGLCVINGRQWLYISAANLALLHWHAQAILEKF
ncbi:MAG: hypothetical protein DYG88_07290 [Chloroflexi bacterium CFX4]|nr:hypothetical protein [Chloroflexi bacterium CFX4]